MPAFATDYSASVREKLHEALALKTVYIYSHFTAILLETIMTENLLTRLLLVVGLFAGLMFGTGNAAAGIALAVLAGTATWLLRSQNLLKRHQ